MATTFLDEKDALESLDSDAQPIDTAMFALVGDVDTCVCLQLATMASLAPIFLYSLLKMFSLGYWIYNAPHTLADMIDSEWNRSYSRELGAYPVPAVANDKFWPTVNRIDDVFGDRNLICSCPDLDSYWEFGE